MDFFFIKKNLLNGVKFNIRYLLPCPLCNDRCI